MNLRRCLLPAAGVLAALAMSGFAAPGPSAPAGAPPSLTPLRTPESAGAGPSLAPLQAPTPVGGAPETAGVPPVSASAPPVESAVPAIPDPVAGSGSSSWPVLIIAVIVAVLAAGFLIRQRRRGGGRPAWTPAYADAPAPSGGGLFGGLAPSHGSAPAGAAPIAAGERELTEVLRRLAAGGVSAAIGQQIERLLGRPDPGRDALVQATVHYRDQLAGTSWEPELLTALTTAGIREIRPADGEVFDGRTHEAADAVAAPAPEYHDRIAQTVHCGYLDHDRVLRPPRVVVYRADGPA